MKKEEQMEFEFEYAHPDYSTGTCKVISMLLLTVFVWLAFCIGLYQFGYLNGYRKGFKVNKPSETYIDGYSDGFVEGETFVKDVLKSNVNYETGPSWKISESDSLYGEGINRTEDAK